MCKKNSFYFAICRIFMEISGESVAGGVRNYKKKMTYTIVYAKFFDFFVTEWPNWVSSRSTYLRIPSSLMIAR